MCITLSTEQVTAAFKKFDLNGDDELDYEEFCRLMTSRDKKNEKKRDEDRREKLEGKKRKKEEEEKRIRRVREMERGLKW